jgi:TolB protein
MNPDGSNVTQLTFTTGDDWNPVYSPDGTKIAFQSVVNNQSDIFVINTNGTGLVNLTNHPDYDGAPSWSPDGTKLAFVSRRTGGYRIYSMNANGTNVTQLSTQPYSNNPAWSPDGQRIAYDADTDGSSRVFPEIYLMNADGSGQTMLYAMTEHLGTWLIRSVCLICLVISLEILRLKGCHGNRNRRRSK